ncbi:MAG: hypothetical protein SFU98_05295 [Leptospiraceae bacterium]|nr:hypothetical protein [Leptospiraceae bacterium]
MNQFVYCAIFLIILIHCKTDSPTIAQKNSPSNQKSKIIENVKIQKFEPYAEDAISKAYKIEGWEVEWHNNEKDRDKVLSYLSEGLKLICKTIPKTSCNRVKKFTISFNENPDKGAAGIYLGGRVTIYSKKAFLDDTLHILFHEIAHGFDESILQVSDIPIGIAYSNAMTKQIYGKVNWEEVNYYNLDGNYLTSNMNEYFAELSCAYFFGLNYFPYNKETLKKVDPEGYQAIQDAWSLLENN